jgi:hypothetical protein
MSGFDPNKPLDDPSVWYPKGMYIEKGRKDEGEMVFVLADEDMAALNRYTWSGALLPTTRDALQKNLGILDGNEISKEVWAAADDLLDTYSKVGTEDLVLRLL